MILQVSIGKNTNRKPTMITNLTFNVEFAPTEKYPQGKVIKGDHVFEKGLTAITGPNEAGKSLRIEIIRYALFGSKALRGAASTYKSIEVELDFVVLGAAYKLKRKGSKVNLTKDGEELATGTKPVNDAVRRVLGYDMDVFDIANACLQGEIEAMTNMRPSDRKAMVDRTIGLNAIDEVLKGVSQDLSSTKAAMELLKDKVIEVHVEPIKPKEADENNSEELEQRLLILREKAQDKKFMEGQLKALQCSAPTLVLTGEKIPETIDELKAQAHAVELQFSKLSVMKERIANFAKIQEALAGVDVKALRHYLEQDYPAKWLAFHNYEKKRLHEPSFTQQEIDFLREGFKKREQESKMISVECPQCQHGFQVKNDGHVHEDKFNWSLFDTLNNKLNIKQAKDLNAREHELAMYIEFERLERITQPSVPEMPEAVGLKAILKLADDYKDFDAAHESSLVHDQEVGFNQVRQELETKIKQKQVQVIEEDKYNKALDKYKNYLAMQAELEPKLKDLGDVDLLLEKYNEEYIIVRNYEQAHRDYIAKQEAQANALSTLKDLETNAESLSNVKKSLSELKPKVKMHLLPSLNRVASTLLAQMTNNARNSIVVNEDFDILVDGQAVNTLSGSGKAIANLAVRIGLGTVLTNKVFSVFLADEIDASMDEERAAYTADCLQNLTEVITQIILVSHQKPDADHHIEV